MDKNTTSKVWRKRTKERMVMAMGGKCQICGYDKNPAAFDFHHIDASTKLFGLAGAKANHISWDKIVIELRKCLILCANCHRELHSGELDISNLKCPFNEKYADYRKTLRDKEKRECPVCKQFKHFEGVTCSRTCAGRKSRKVDWDNYDIMALLQEGHNFSSIGKLVGCSDNAVRKRFKKIMAP